MLKMMIIVATLVLVLHGLIHLMGTASYMKLAEVQGLPYKTTVLGGRWDLGAGGIAVYGALWAVAAVGFVIAALAFWFGWAWWQSALVAVTLLSLALTALDLERDFCRRHCQPGDLAAVLAGATSHGGVFWLTANPFRVGAIPSQKVA